MVTIRHHYVITIKGPPTQVSLNKTAFIYFILFFEKFPNNKRVYNSNQGRGYQSNLKPHRNRSMTRRQDFLVKGQKKIKERGTRHVAGRY